MIPRTIWCVWFQGWDNAPPIIRACAATWRQHNPDWRINYLSRPQLSYYLRDFEALFGDKDIPFAALSNIVRTSLLSRFGGVWVDASCYCLRPVNEWIYLACEPTGFFAFDRPAPDRLLASWFLASALGSPLVNRLDDAVTLYWSDRRAEPDDYFWFHYLFGDLCNSDPEFQHRWDLVPKLSAAGPHCFAPYDEHMLKPISHTHRLIVETAQVPVLKLTHKIDHSNRVGTAYRWLCARTPEFSPR
jgi:hypothetical protein